MNGADGRRTGQHNVVHRRMIRIIKRQTARNELLRIYHEEQTDSDLRTAIADHLRERTGDDKRVPPTEAKPVLSVSGQP